MTLLHFLSFSQTFRAPLRQFKAFFQVPLNPSCCQVVRLPALFAYASNHLQVSWTHINHRPQNVIKIISAIPIAATNNENAKDSLIFCFNQFIFLISPPVFRIYRWIWHSVKLFASLKKRVNFIYNLFCFIGLICA